MQIDTLNNKLTDCNENSLLSSTITKTPRQLAPAAPPPADPTIKPESGSNRNRSERRQQRRAAINRGAKDNRSPEEKVSAAEALLQNICNQAANMWKHKPRSSQRPARVAYRAARQVELKRQAQLEKAEVAAAFQGCGYTSKLTSTQIKNATIKRTIPTAVVDSGASSTCVKPAEEETQESECGGYRWTRPPCRPTGKKSRKVFSMALGHTAPGGDVVDLPLPLREAAREGHTVEGIQNNLYSVNRLVKQGYAALFTDDGFKVYDATNKKIRVSRAAVLNGYYCQDEGLWRIPLLHDGEAAQASATFRQSPQEILREGPPPATNHINNVYELRAQPQLIRYYHAAAGFPTMRTWLKAIANGHYQSWLGLTEAAVRRNFPDSTETARGHGRKIRMNLRSTKTLVKEEEEQANLVGEDSQTSYCSHKVYNLKEEMDRKMYSDQTGKFPVTSYKGKQYVMVVYETTSNNILVEGMRNRTSGEMVATYQILVDRLKEGGFEPQMHILDNEISQDFKNAIKTNQMKFQLVPPNDHRSSVALKMASASVMTGLVMYLWRKKTV